MLGSQNSRILDVTKVKMLQPPVEYWVKTNVMWDLRSIACTRSDFVNCCLGKDFLWRDSIWFFSHIAWDLTLPFELFTINYVVFMLLSHTVIILSDLSCTTKCSFCAFYFLCFKSYCLCPLPLFSSAATDAFCEINTNATFPSAVPRKVLMPIIMHLL